MYDSLYSSSYARRQLRGEYQRLIKYRYGPNIPHRYVNVIVHTKHPDVMACGVFAIAYAVMLIFQQDRTTIPLFILPAHQFSPNTDLARDLQIHLRNMYIENRIDLLHSRPQNE